VVIALFARGGVLGIVENLLRRTSGKRAPP
jgi:hypothetical protein